MDSMANDHAEALRQKASSHEQHEQAVGQQIDDLKASHASHVAELESNMQANMSTTTGEWEAKLQRLMSEL